MNRVRRGMLHYEEGVWWVMWRVEKVSVGERYRRRIGG
jgi:hypothetical protein